MVRTGTSKAPKPQPAGKGNVAGPRHAPYHHGDLRAALVAAATEELADKGIEEFTLRGCARRAGVSHAAPAHHFRDVRALLTEVAAIGFEALSASMEEAAAGLEPRTLDYIAAIGRGYVAFAAAHPQSFKLLFRVERLDCDDPHYTTAADKAFSYPVRAVGAYFGVDDPMSDPDRAAEVIGLWSIVHGMADLMLAGQFDRRSHPVEPSSVIENLSARLTRQLFEGPSRP